MNRFNSAVKRNMSSHKTIGMLTDWIEDQYHLNLLYGISDLAHARNCNLFCFEGGSINAPLEYEARRNIVYDLASKENVDGLIILSASIGHFVNLDSTIQFCRQYHPLPTVVIGLEIPDIPSILVDNASGTRQLITHLVQVHGYKRFAFIKGAQASQDAIQRYEAFIKTLKESGIKNDPDLVVSGDYTPLSGEEAIRILIDQRKAEFDVVVACNDDMASGALKALKARGINVPKDVAVVGFDNLDFCAYTSPPLTTVAYSIYELGWRAAETLIDLLEKKNVPMLQTVPAKLFVRESCGCPAFSMITGHRKTSPRTSARPEKEKIISNIIKKAHCVFWGLKNFPVEDAVKKLYMDFFEDLEGIHDGNFLAAWNGLLDQAAGTSKDIFSWQAFISEFRNCMLPYLNNPQLLLKAEDLLQQARVMIGERALKIEKFEHNEYLQINSAMGFLREQLLSTLEEPQLMDILARDLPGLGIKSCYLIMFEKNKPEKSRVALAYNENGRIADKDGIVFPSRKLLPKNLLDIGRQRNMLVVALNFTKPQLGFILFEMGPRDGKLYGTLRRMICGALQATMLFKQIQTQANNLIVQREKLSKNLSRLKRVMGGFIKAIALTVETRDPYTAGHQQRVAALATAIATEMRLSKKTIESIRMAGIVHDLGKIYVPSEILNKPGILTDVEFGLIRKHPEIAYEILKNIDFPWPIAQIILQHHERIDGSGYPRGLKDQNIRLESKILAVADVVEAMISRRPYREALEIEKALHEIHRKKGVFYDPVVVDECINLFRSKRFKFSNKAK